MCHLLHTLTPAFFSLSVSFLFFHAYGASAAPPLWKQLDAKQTTSIFVNIIYKTTKNISSSRLKTM